MMAGRKGIKHKVRGGRKGRRPRRPGGTQRGRRRPEIRSSRLKRLIWQSARRCLALSQS